ncbi:uncharacterized protein LOC128228517 [Mya arenaria]|uniref:uncharacterized protein LOC128228517 n=1 Tax=Mya arenaria TaxID=6604 RepID=UPI0022E211EF|nr:uncharacterized protein LOC128228517 [Mya arenaria]XP_052795825.1 uncharacterized protein LOC128228517 [Mya arenaria]
MFRARVLIRCIGHIRTASMTHQQFQHVHPTMNRLITTLAWPELSRNFHTTPVPMKKMDPALYQKVSVFDVHGHFVTDVELLVIQHFCRKYNRFTFEEIPEEEHLKMPEPHEKLKRYRIKEKETKKSQTEKHVKTVKFGKKGVREDPKLNKVTECLVNHGAVNIEFLKSAPGLNEVLRMFGESRIDPEASQDKTVMNVSAKPLNAESFKILLKDIHDHESAHIKSVLELLDLQKS